MASFRTEQEWQQRLPAAVTDDPLWRMKVYRQALFLSALCAEDARRLHALNALPGLVSQLSRATDSISANIAEGYSRGTPKARGVFYEYALGSARESRDWYLKCESPLGAQVCAHRIDLLAQILRQLLTIIAAEKSSGVRESPVDYAAGDLPTNSTEIPFT